MESPKKSRYYYQLNQIKRIRVVRRDDGYYAQFLIDHTRTEEKILTGKQMDLDIGLNHFYTDSEGNKLENPRFLRKDERKLKRLQRSWLSRPCGDKKN
ncbi:transposase [Gloeothece citriformis]|uniref:transposase n=1 Tax=Gloeothece citriformis TaxID=2546356 RepID=UPI000173D1C3|nr:transposase [Gloeothece citriformis]